MGSEACRPNRLSAGATLLKLKRFWAAYRGDGVRKTAVSHTVGLVKEILLILLRVMLCSIDEKIALHSPGTR